jgi:nitrogen fixation NifU-like protein
MYSEQVMDHFANPHNVGELDGANAVGEVGNARCGDIMRMYLKIEDGVIKDATFKTFGCCAAIASSSVTTDLIKGMTVDEALNFKNASVVDALGGLPPAKIHCSVLAEEAIKKAIDNYREGQKEA